MNETDWWSCTEPGEMLWFLQDEGSDRKLRLFGCACCRRIWPLLTNVRSQEVVRLPSGTRTALHRLTNWCGHGTRRMW